MTDLYAIKSELSKIVASFDTNRRCIYVDYPLHTNVGDLLINLGSEQMFVEHNLFIWKRYNYYDFPKQIPGIRKDDVFLLNGGGNLGDVWYNFQSFRESILEQYPHNRIIFLPQTVHFISREREVASIHKMMAHKNLHVFVRDHASLERLHNGGLKCVSPAPCMAHGLTGVLKPTGQGVPNSTLRFIRRDREASEPPPEVTVGDGPSVDWDTGALPISRLVTHRLVVNTVKGIGRYGPPSDLHRLWYWHRDKMVSSAIDLFSSYQTVITNRLHGMLFGILLGRKVIAWDNSYGKLSAYHESWLRDVPGLTFHRTPATPIPSPHIPSAQKIVSVPLDRSVAV
jgi:pyruvyl transferase EpsO